MRIQHGLVPATYLILKRGDHVLLLERANTGYMDGHYSLVSGHVEPRESFKEAMVREAYEEAGIKIKHTDLKIAHVQHCKAESSERIHTFFVVDGWEGEVCNMEPEKCTDLSWFHIEELPKTLIPSIGIVIEHFKNSVLYSERGWE